MKVAGIDLSSFFVDVVLVDQDTGRVDWHRYPLGSDGDAFDRARQVRLVMPGPTSELWDDVLAIGIEDPAGRHGVIPLVRVQGAILACLPAATLVNAYKPARWKFLAGMPGGATKDMVRTRSLIVGSPWAMGQAADQWPQDAHDAHLIARAMQADLDAQRETA
jgi:hypothetical protein